MPWAAVGIRMISRRASFFDSLLTIAPLGAADNPLGRRHKRPAPFRALGNNSGLWRARYGFSCPNASTSWSAAVALYRMRRAGYRFRGEPGETVGNLSTRAVKTSLKNAS